jgi:hypothetical protein
MNTLQVHRLTLALTYILEYAPKEHPDDDIDYQYQQALVNAAAILNNHAKIKWLPDDEGSSIDEQSMSDISGLCDVYIDGVWQNNLVAKMTASVILSQESEQS